MLLISSIGNTWLRLPSEAKLFTARRSALRWPLLDDGALGETDGAPRRNVGDLAGAFE